MANVAVMRLLARTRGWLERRFGGRARTKVIAVLAAVLALDTADMGAVGAMSGLLERHFAVTKAELGLLVALSSGVAAVGTLLFGWLADRTPRTRVLAIAVALWGAVSAVSGSATSWVFLLATRVAIGIAASAALPLVASLVGDYFPARDRATVYGYIISGEVVGTGFGFIVAGELASISWRLGFWSLALASPFVAWALHRLPEPSRGGADRLARGQERMDRGGRRDRARGEGSRPEDRMFDRVRKAGIHPRERLAHAPDPRGRSLAWAFWYVLRIPTNLVLIVGSALTYWYFASLRVFGVQYVTGDFGVAHALAVWLIVGFGLGALAGIWAGGNGADALIRRGHLRGRIVVATGGLFATCALFLVALLLGTSWAAMPLLFAAAAALGAVPPPLDAARLDIMHPALWGRAESVRALLRKAAEAAAPVVMGWLAGTVFGGGTTGLRDALLVMLGPLCAGGLVGLVALRTYLTDVATAATYADRTGGAAARVDTTHEARAPPGGR